MHVCSAWGGTSWSVARSTLKPRGYAATTVDGGVDAWTYPIVRPVGPRGPQEKPADAFR